MFTLNSTLEKSIVNADGNYLDSKALQPLEHYLQSFTVRLKTYQHLRDHSVGLVNQALQHFTKEYPDLMKRSGKRCQYDMAEVLRYIALAILRDDETFFTEQMMMWLDTIIFAYKKNKQCAIAYRHLQSVIKEHFPEQESNLIIPYIDTVISTLQSHA